jgi:hypothetical protein
MTSEADCGKSKGGLFGALGRVFGGGRPAEPAEAGADHEPAGSKQTGTAMAVVEQTQTAPGVLEQPDPGGEDQEEALVLGPAFQSPAAANGAVSAGKTGQAVSVAGSAPAGAGTTEGAEMPWAADDGEEILARLRSLRDGEPPLIGGAWKEYERARSGSADDGAGKTDTPEAGAVAGLHWLPGEEHDDGEVEGAAVGAGPELQERMEAEAMGRRIDAGSGGDEPAAEGEDEDATAAGAVSITAGAEGALGPAREQYLPRPKGEDMGSAPEAADSGAKEAEGHVVTVGTLPETGEAGSEPGMSEETVRRLIREELEGELGERLSANIRRMIREEVAHALLRQR